MKSSLKRSIGEVVTDYGTKVMRILKKRLQRSLFDFYGDVKADNLRTREAVNAPTTPVDGDGGIIYTKSADGKLYYKSNEISEVELSSQGTNTTYSVSCVDGDNSDEEKIRLTGSDSSTDDVVLEAGTGLSIARDGDKITFTNTVTDTDTVLTTEQVQDIAGALVATGGTKTGITVTYDDANNNMDFVVDDLHNVGVNGSEGNLLIDNGDGTVTSISQLEYNNSNQVLTLRSSTSAKPMFLISNSNTDAEAPVISLAKGTAGADGDDLGRIKFDGFDPDGNEQTFAQILGEIVVAANGSEEGKLTIIVASHDGEEQPGLILASGNAEDEVDVTVGNGATSITTVAGTLTMGSTAALDNSGNLLTNAATATALTSGDKTIEGNLRIGGSGDTSNNWISIDAQNGNDSSGGGITFYETGTYSVNAPQYGAKIVYNEDADEFAIGTMHNNVFMRQIYMPRGNDYVYFADAAFIEGTTPVLFLSDTSTTVADGDVLGQIAYRNEDDDASTLNIKGIATEDHASGTNGGSKFEIQVTPNGTSTLATAVTIDQNKDLLIEGDLQVKGNDIKDSGGTTAFTFSGSGGVTVPSGNLEVGNHATVSKTLTVGGAGTTPAVTMATAKITLSTADCNSLHTTPVQLVSAAGANTVLLPVGGMIRIDRAATQTNSAANVNMHYADQEPGVYSDSSLYHIRRFMYNETGDRVIMIGPMFGLQSSQNLTDDVNKALELSCDSAFTTNCFTSVTIYLTYNVIDIS